MHSLKEILSFPPDGRSVTASGWVRTKRDGKNVCFIALNDGSCMRNLQAVVDKENGCIPAETLLRCGTGAALTVTGKLIPSEGGGEGLVFIHGAVGPNGAAAAAKLTGAGSVRVEAVLVHLDAVPGFRHFHRNIIRLTVAHAELAHLAVMPPAGAPSAHGRLDDQIIVAEILVLPGHQHRAHGQQVPCPQRFREHRTFQSPQD